MVEQAFSLIGEHGAGDNDADNEDEDDGDDDDDYYYDDDDYVVLRSFHYTKFLSGIFSLHDIHSCSCLSQSIN